MVKLRKSFFFYFLARSRSNFRFSLPISRLFPDIKSKITSWDQRGVESRPPLEVVHVPDLPRMALPFFLSSFLFLLILDWYLIILR